MERPWYGTRGSLSLPFLAFEERGSPSASHNETLGGGGRSPSGAARFAGGGVVASARNCVGGVVANAGGRLGACAGAGNASAAGGARVGAPVVASAGGRLGAYAGTRHASAAGGARVGMPEPSTACFPSSSPLANARTRSQRAPGPQRRHASHRQNAAKTPPPAHGTAKTLAWDRCGRARASPMPVSS